MTAEEAVSGLSLQISGFRKSRDFAWPHLNLPWGNLRTVDDAPEKRLELNRMVHDAGRMQAATTAVRCGIELTMVATSTCESIAKGERSKWRCC